MDYTKLLGEEAKDLLTHDSKGIPAESLELPKDPLGELGVHTLGLRPGDELVAEGGDPRVGVLVRQCPTQQLRSSRRESSQGAATFKTCSWNTITPRVSTSALSSSGWA